MLRLGEPPYTKEKDLGSEVKSRDLMRTMVMTSFGLGLATVLAEIYAAAVSLGLGPWQGALAFHSVVGVGIVLLFCRQGTLSRQFACWGIGKKAPSWFVKKPWLAYAPALGLILGASILGGVSFFLAAAPKRGPISTPLVWIWLIPWAEELFFRGGIGDFYRRMLPGLGGVWLSAATFALAHADITFEHLLQGQVGLPLGPFLLGLLCESVYLLSGSLLPAIAVHAAANATVIIFEAFDPRWLDWLGILYV